jgi:16S rRNA (cytidine1402-2'-O)-methyltransferase
MIPSDSDDGPAIGLYVVATPIGHLSDLSARAVEVLRSVDVLAVEDTRVARVLLDHIGARPRLLSTHAHNEAGSAQAIVERLRAGERIALTCDAGTPGISDPGARVVAAVHAAGLPVIPIPGPSAVTALLSAAGLGDGRFRFDGFLPARSKARRQRLAELAASDVVVVFYESPHRIVETAADLAAELAPDRVVVIGRELTKRFEQVHRCGAAELPGWLDADPNRRRGEFVLAFDAAPPRPIEALPIEAMLRVLCEELPVRQAARLVARIGGLKANDLYRQALALRGRGQVEGVDEGDEDVDDGPPRD